jgi:hypothetical protein
VDCSAGFGRVKLGQGSVKWQGEPNHDRGIPPPAGDVNTKGMTCVSHLGGWAYSLKIVTVVSHPLLVGKVFHSRAFSTLVSNAYRSL